MHFLISFFLLFFSYRAAAVEVPSSEVERQQYLAGVQTELNYWDAVVSKEERAFEAGQRNEERGRVIQDMELMIRDLRGQLAKLSPASPKVWRHVQPEVEAQLTELRQMLQ